MKRIGVRLGAAFSVIAMSVGVATAADAPGSRINESAEKALRGLAAAMQAAKTLSCELTLVTTTESEGVKQEVSTTYTLAAEKPNKLALRHKTGREGNTVVSDGEKMFVYIGPTRLYDQKPAPASLDDLFQSGGPMAGSMLFIDSLLRSDVYGAIMEGVNKAEYVGTEKLGGQECQRLRFSQDQMDWDLWITTGEKPVVVRVQMDMSKGFAVMSSQMPGMKSMKMTAVNTFQNWQLGGASAGDAFVFTPPAGARKFESGSAGATGDAEEDPLALIGRKAPPVDLPLLDGGNLRMPDAKLSNTVVVLDFWATWCGPCVRSLPILAKVAADYAGKGVAFYAVNQQEQPDRIKDFLEKHDIACTVALDEAGNAGTLYKLSRIPQTVLIGKDGAVKTVHIGMILDLDKRLRAELDDLIAGKDLPPARP